MEFEELGDSIIHLILSRLDSDDKARFACVNTRFGISASDESLWSVHCKQEIHLSAPVDPFGSPLPSFRVAYQAWRKAYSMYPWPLVQRVIKCYDKLKSWLKINYPLALDTLQRGATEGELNEFEESLGVKLPAPSRVIHRIFDGQELQRDKLIGLIGGYSFYDQLANVNLLSLRDIRRHTERQRRRKWWSMTSKYLVVALCEFSGKIYFLDCTSGQLFVGTVNLKEDGEMMPCVPTTLLNSIASHDSDEVHDGFLLWLEEHERRLQNGVIGVRAIGVRGEGRLNSISQFPGMPPLCSTAVTNGVQVRASGVFLPEMTDLDKEKTYSFAYSIRMSLLPEGCTLNGMRHESCQLYWRRWLFRENDTVVDDVNGEAVIGKYPLLIAGGAEFVYESCCDLKSVPGSVEGSFTFVPGRLSDPKGDEFEVEVARFPLELPDYIF